jgi:opacity protein-like surface antigen
MKKSMLICAMTATMSLIAANSAAAQEATGASPALDLSRFSVQAGLGFFAEDNLDGFLLNFEGSYHFDQNWSAGVDFQLGFDDDFLLFSMPFYARYDFGNLPVDAAYFSKLHPFAKLGLGFTYAEIDVNFAPDIDDTGFLFLIGGGMAYPINDNFSLESTMQFNITTNDFFEDDFYFSWEIISLRYRF